MSRKILVCDDDEAISEVIKIILEQNNYEVKTLCCGKAIQKKVEEYLPDLILLDLWMPGIDGKEITKLLKLDTKTKHIPIIIFSALSNTSKISKEVGADGFLTKPFDINDLLKKVESFLQKRD